MTALPFAAMAVGLVVAVVGGWIDSHGIIFAAGIVAGAGALGLAVERGL